MAITEAYNRFYQAIYGTNFCYLPPAELLSWVSQIPVTSEQQLESLFVLYNAALCRSPLQDGQRVAKKRSRKHSGAGGRQQKVVPLAWGRPRPCGTEYEQGHPFCYGLQERFQSQTHIWTQ